MLSASIGGGHVAAANALEAAFGQAGVPCLHVDLLQYTSAPFRTLYRRSYFDLVRAAPEMVDWLGRRLDRRPSEAPTRMRRLRARVSRLISYQLPRVLTTFEPDLILHTHFLPPDVLAQRRSGPRLPLQGVVVTDFGAHALWMSRDVARYFVATEDVAVHLRASGVDAARVEVTGIPVDPRFEHLPSQAEARSRLGLEPDVDVVLLLLSGLERRAAEVILDGLRQVRWPLHALVVSGRSPELLDVARDAATEGGDLVRIHPYGMRTDMPTLMAAASIVVGKPGGLTVSEALASGRPYAIVQPYPLQEEANATYLLEQGAAIRIDPLTTFSAKLRGVLSDPVRLAAMQDRARAIGHPAAARSVVRSSLLLLDQAQSAQPKSR